MKNLEETHYEKLTVKNSEETQKHRKTWKKLWTTREETLWACVCGEKLSVKNPTVKEISLWKTVKNSDT